MMIVLSIITGSLLLTASVVNHTYSELEEDLFFASFKRILHQAQTKALMHSEQCISYCKDSHSYKWHGLACPTLYLPVPKSVDVKKDYGAHYKFFTGYSAMKKLDYQTTAAYYVFQYQLGSGHFSCKEFRDFY